ncbi:MAG: prolyl oligopeptidase family serine peptidase [Alphaproteobacteria bacterium]|nr:prolyl oligopeptidase family serine peptidase [Alphaproteobacteria bacterium]
MRLIIRLWFAVLTCGACVSNALALTFDDFARLPEVETAAISPDAKHFVTLQPVAARRSVVIYHVDGGYCAFAPNDVKIRQVYWVNSSHLLISVTRPQTKFSLYGDYRPHEWTWMLLIDKDCKNPKMILPDRSGASAYGFRGRVLSRLPGDDHHVLVVAGKIYKLDIDTARATAISSTERSRCDFSRRFVADATGKARICYSRVGRDTAIFARLDGSDEWVQVYRYSWDDRHAREISFEGFAADPDVAFVVTRNGGERLAAYEFDLRTKSLGRIVYQNPKSDVVGYILEPGSKRVVGVEYETFDGDRVEWLDRSWAQLWADLSATFEEGALEFVSFADDRKIFTIYHRGPDDPAGSYYLVNLNKPEVSKLGSMYPAVTPAEYVQPKLIHYKARDGLDIPAYLTMPRNVTGKVPLVVLPHGGPESRDDQAAYDDWQQFLTWRGYAVLQPQFRGSTGLGRSFIEAGYKQWGLKMQDDITDGVLDVIRQGLVDKDRICIFGWSYGGYAALAGLAFTPDLYKCGVAGAPISDLLTMTGFVNGYSGYGFDEEYWYWPRAVGDVTRDRERMAATSPALHADRIRAPLLLIHGTYDTTVPIGQSDEMAKAMERAGKPYEYVRLEGEDHHLFKADTRRKTYEALDQFLAKYLRQ